MTTGVACPPVIQQFFDNRGNPLVGGSILTQVGGVNTAVYQDSGLTTPLPNPVPLNSRGEVSTAAGASSQMFLTPNTVYTFTASDADGNQIWVATYVNGVQLSGELAAAALNPVTDTAILNSYLQTAAETAAGVAPVNYSYPPYNAFRYMTGAQITAVQAGNLSQDVTAALNSWLKASVGQSAVLPAGSYLISSQLTAGSGTRIVGDARGQVLIVYQGAATITGGSMLVFSAGSANICSAFSIENVQFECTNIVSGNATAQLELLNPLYFRVENCVFGGANATGNALTGIYIHQNGFSFVPPLGGGVLRNIEAVVEPPTAGLAGSYAVLIEGNSAERMENIMMDGEGAIEHFGVGASLQNVESSVLMNWEFRGASADAGDTCLQLINCQSVTIIAPTIAPAPAVGNGISIDANSTFNLVLNPTWNLSSGNPIAAYADSGSYNSLIGPGNPGGTFTPIAKLVGSILLQKPDGAGPNLAIKRTNTDSTEGGFLIYADHVPTNQAFRLVDRGSGVNSQDLDWIGANGTVFDRVDQLGQRYMTAPNAAPASANLANSQFTVWLDEVNNNIKFECKLSNGTVKTGTLAIS